jgi:hypothetical protein
VTGVSAGIAGRSSGRVSKDRGLDVSRWRRDATRSVPAHAALLQSRRARARRSEESGRAAAGDGRPPGDAPRPCSGPSHGTGTARGGRRCAKNGIDVDDGDPDIGDEAQEHVPLDVAARAVARGGPDATRRGDRAASGPVRHAEHSPSITSGANAWLSPRSMKSSPVASLGSSCARSFSTSVAAAGGMRR